MVYIERQQTTLVGEPRPDSPDGNKYDIYRGVMPSPALNRSLSHDSRTSISTESLPMRGRLGAIAAVVELAITRWARRDDSASSSSSSSSSCSFTGTHPQSQRMRIRRSRSSAGTLQTIQSERDIAARINQIKAREESRLTPRGFTLYLPPFPSVGGPSIHPNESGLAKSTIWTASLPLVLNRLTATLKRTTKFQRQQIHTYTGKSQGLHPQDNYMTPEDTTNLNMTTMDRGMKGKHKSPTSLNVEGGSNERATARKAWFLDVASPTWEDMRAIGKLLHLHPLTLEDILQRDPREKLEHFPKLGYYFISFRAIESQATRNKRKASEDLANLNNSEQDDGLIGEANVYLVVFDEGICTFHFTDISEHIDRIRNRITLLEEVVNMSSDWIAHGILDSIVDSFFPFLEEIEKEVVAIDNLVFAGLNQTFSAQETSQITLPGTQTEGLPLTLPDNYPVKQEIGSFETKERPALDDTKPRTSAILLPLVVLHSFKSMFFRSQKTASQHSTTHATLRRMARTRRLVTSLARLLATKSEVVAQIRKRLLTSSPSRLGNKTSKDDNVDVAIYMGDVQDHILTLEHSLAHYERMLSQSHPTYLSQLRTAVALTKSGTDRAIIYLTVLTIAVLCVQTLLGTFSLNITIPTNEHSINGHYYVFGIIIALSGVILCSYLCVVRWWWVQAKRRRGAVL